MKRIITFGLLMLGVSVFSQEAGKAGELLKNEATKNEMQNRRIEGSSTSENNPDTKKRIITSYNWNQNYGYSEVFLRIPERGYFTVEIGNQLMSNTTGNFRFFDLNSGRNSISIYQNGYLLYRSPLNIRNNTRLVLDFFSNHGLYLLATQPIQGQNYGINQWDDIWNNPYGNNNYYGSTYYGNGYYGNIMSDSEFRNFINSMERSTSFDKDKIQFIKQQVKTINFTSKQIQMIMSELSFDKSKLELGEMIYRYCADKHNFYMVYESFDFNSYRQKLMNYVSNYNV